MKFTVNRKRWARGGKGGDPELRNRSKNQCCLGFCARQLGYKAHEIQAHDLPTMVDASYNRSLCLPLYRLQRHAALINDDAVLKDPERERLLKGLFRSYGHTIRFEG